MASKRSWIAALLGLYLSGAALASPRSSSSLLREGVALHNRGHYAQAIQRFEEAYAKDPALTRLLLLIGVSALNLGDGQRAISSFEDYAEKEPALTVEDREVLRGYYDEAARKLQEDYQRERRHPERLLFAGRAAYHLERHEEALILFERCRPALEVEQRGRLRRYLEALRDRLLVLYRLDPRRRLTALLLSRTYSALEQPAEAARFRRRYEELGAPPPAPLPLVVTPRSSAPPRPHGRPLWRVLSGAGLAAVGLGVLGLGISGVVVDGSCAQPLEAPLTGCARDYDTLGIGAGLLAGGAVLTLGGAALAVWPLPFRRQAEGVGPQLALVF